MAELTEEKKEVATFMENFLILQDESCEMCHEIHSEGAWPTYKLQVSISRLWYEIMYEKKSENCL